MITPLPSESTRMARRPAVSDLSAAHGRPRNGLKDKRRYQPREAGLDAATTDGRGDAIDGYCRGQLDEGPMRHADASARGGPVCGASSGAGTMRNLFLPCPDPRDAESGEAGSRCIALTPLPMPGGKTRGDGHSMEARASESQPRSLDVGQR